MRPAPIVPCLAFNHLNFVVDDLDETVRDMAAAFGSQFVSDLPRPEWHAGLVYFDGVLVEVFAPTQLLLSARYGPHHLGIEYQIPSVDAARDALLADGIRIVRDIGVAIHTHPADTAGIALEFYGGNFHTDPDVQWIEPLRSRSYWSDEHPLHSSGMTLYTVATRDLDRTCDFLGRLLGAQPTQMTGETPANTRARTLTLANTTLEVMAPTGDGLLLDHLDRYGPGIRSFTLGVEDVDAAAEHLRSVGLTPAEVDRPGTAAFDIARTGGLRVELATASR